MSVLGMNPAEVERIERKLDLLEQMGVTQNASLLSTVRSIYQDKKYHSAMLVVAAELGVELREQKFQQTQASKLELFLIALLAEQFAESVEDYFDGLQSNMESDEEAALESIREETREFMEELAEKNQQDFEVTLQAENEEAESSEMPVFEITADNYQEVIQNAEQAIEDIHNSKEDLSVDDVVKAIRAEELKIEAADAIAASEAVKKHGFQNGEKEQFFAHANSAAQADRHDVKLGLRDMEKGFVLITEKEVVPAPSAPAATASLDETQASAMPAEVRDALAKLELANEDPLTRQAINQCFKAAVKANPDAREEIKQARQVALAFYESSQSADEAAPSNENQTL